MPRRSADGYPLPASEITSLLPEPTFICRANDYWKHHKNCNDNGNTKTGTTLSEDEEEGTRNTEIDLCKWEDDDVHRSWEKPNNAKPTT
jgi:hypothetical protein